MCVVETHAVQVWEASTIQRLQSSRGVYDFGSAINDETLDYAASSDPTHHNQHHQP